jgi:excisionase family DNA binding protein
MRTTDDDELLTPEELSDRWKIPRSTLYGWRYRGVGPRSVRIGRHIRYRAADVDEWLESQASGLAEV